MLTRKPLRHDITEIRHAGLGWGVCREPTDLEALPASHPRQVSPPPPAARPNVLGLFWAQTAGRASWPQAVGGLQDGGPGQLWNGTAGQCGAPGGLERGPMRGCGGHGASVEKQPCRVISRSVQGWAHLGPVLTLTPSWATWRGCRAWHQGPVGLHTWPRDRGRVTSLTLVSLGFLICKMGWQDYEPR